MKANKSKGDVNYWQKVKLLSYRGATVHRSIESLVKAGYITPGEEQEDATNRFYVATEKLKNLRRTLKNEHGDYSSFLTLVKEKSTLATH